MPYTEIRVPNATTLNFYDEPRRKLEYLNNFKGITIIKNWKESTTLQSAEN